MHNSVFGCTELVFKAKQIEETIVELLLSASLSVSLSVSLSEFHAFSSPGVA